MSQNLPWKTASVVPFILTTDKRAVEQKESLLPGLLPRARRAVRSIVGMIGPSLVLRTPSGQGGVDAPRHPVGGVRNRLVGQVSVAFGGLDRSP